jgi:hypothetical protein
MIAKRAEHEHRPFVAEQIKKNAVLPERCIDIATHSSGFLQVT